jgi:hypothetical protein
MENGFVSRVEGPWFLEFPYATFRFPFGTFVFRRNTRPGAEGPWFVRIRAGRMYRIFFSSLLGEARVVSYIEIRAHPSAPLLQLGWDRRSLAGQEAMAKEAKVIPKVLADLSVAGGAWHS